MTSSHLHLSASALKNNLHFFQKNFEGMVFPVLKSNAYGHGILEIAEMLQSENIEMVAVQYFWEAGKIVKKFPQQKVLVLGYTDGETFCQNVSNCLQKNIILSIGDLESLKKILLPLDKGGWGDFLFHLSFNTGMSREGFEMEELPEVLELLEKNPTKNFEGIWSHFADADNDGIHTEHFVQQQKKFSEILDAFEEKNIFPKYIHLGNSHGSLQTNDARINAMRLGIGLYGLHTFPKTHFLYKKFSENLEPVLSWVTKIVSVRKLKKGESVSYNCTFTAEKDTSIATVPVGYFEGVFRKMSNRGAFFCGGKRCNIVGRVCMNYCMIDVSAVKNVKIGDEVELIGKNISADDWAEWCESINYEVVTRIRLS